MNLLFYSAIGRQGKITNYMQFLILIILSLITSVVQGDGGPIKVFKKLSKMRPKG